jgi:DNA-binding MarR family transcriptional regulator
MNEISGAEVEQKIRNLLKQLEADFRAMLDGFGALLGTFKAAHWRVLMAVWDSQANGEPITQTQAKEKISDLPGFQSDKARRALIKELAQSNLISKAIDPSDERKILLSLTDDADRRVNKYLAAVGRNISAFSTDVWKQNSEINLKELRALLTALELRFIEMLRAHGHILETFSLPHWAVLMAIWDADGRLLPQGEAKKLVSGIAGFESDKSQRTVIKDLAQVGFLTKILNPGDERKINLALTDAATGEIQKYLAETRDDIAKSMRITAA